MRISVNFSLLYILFTTLLQGQEVTGRSNDIGSLFEERSRSIVAVEFFVQHEIDRQPSESVGLVIDDKGLVILMDSAVPGWEPYDKFRDFKVFPPGTGGDGYNAEYLGQDHLNGWHYLRVEEAIFDKITPISAFKTAIPSLGEEVWGFGLMGKDFDYKGYFLDSRLALVQELPLKFGFTNREVSVPGGPVFDMTGAFIGWAENPITAERVLYMGRETYKVGLKNTKETQAFLLAEEFFNNVNRVPGEPSGGPRPWIGISGLQPVDRKVAHFLGLENQSALVVGRILKDSPADRGGLQDRDIIVGVGGKIIRKYRPDSVVQSYFEREILSLDPGDTLSLTVVRGDERIDLQIPVQESPTRLNEAERDYFKDLGLSVREFILYDAIGRRLEIEDMTGVIASFVKPNSPVNTSGLLRGDWIKEIDGTEVNSYNRAIELLKGVEEDENRSEFVLLIDRNNETSVLRVKLK